MIKKEKFRICKVCEKKFIQGTGWRKYCSLLCGSKKYKTKFNTRPDIEVKTVTLYKTVQKKEPCEHSFNPTSILREYKNGAMHRQSSCIKCGHKKLIKRGEIKLDSISYVKKTTSICFYETREWKQLRYKVISFYGRKCMACNATESILHVDHIKPRSKYPELELTFDNLQVLCKDCNLGKSNLDETDWR